MTGRCSSRDGNHQCKKELHEKNISVTDFPFSISLPLRVVSVRLIH